MYTVSNDTYVLIPQYLFDENNKEKYLSFNTGRSNISLSFTDTQIVSEQESILIYNLSKQLHSFIENKSPGSKIFHEKAVLLNAAPNLLGKEGMLLNFVEDHFDLLLRINNKTCFFNSFKINSTDDLLYFIYYIAEQYEFDPLSINFVHTGKIPELVSQKLVLKFFPNPNWNFTQQHNYNFIASKALLCE